MQNKFLFNPKVYITGLLLFVAVNFGGCCTPVGKTQILGQSPTEWDTPPDSKTVKPRRNFLTPVLTFLKRDTEEDYILVGKPISFVNNEQRSEWEISEIPEEELEQPSSTTSPSYPVSQANHLTSNPVNNTRINPGEIRQVSSVSLTPAKTSKKIAPQPTDSQEIAELISALNAHEPVNQTRAESLLAELRSIDRTQIQPEVYQYAIDWARSDLIPVPAEPVDEIVAAPKPVNRPQAPPPSPLVKKAPSIDSERLAKNIAKNISQIEITEEKPTAPAPVPTKTRTEETPYLTSQSDIPAGRFSEPMDDSASVPQINPGGYNSKETFRDYVNDSPWIASPNPKYTGSESTHPPQQEWEQAASLAVEALKHKILQAPNPDAAVTDQLRLQILETALHGGNTSLRDSRYHFSGHDETVQSFVSHELFALTTLLDEKMTPEFAVRLQASQPYFQEAQRQLAKSCSLKIYNMQFIQNSDPENPQPGDFRGFGVYTPIKAEFKTDDWAWVYLELENFVSNGGETVGFHTKFSISYEILDTSGNSVLKKSLPSTEETTSSPRRDMAITVPLDLYGIPPGHYRAMVRVVDQNHLRLPMDTQRIDFIVRAESSR